MVGQAGCTTYVLGTLALNSFRFTRRRSPRNSTSPSCREWCRRPAVRRLAYFRNIGTTQIIKVDIMPCPLNPFIFYKMASNKFKITIILAQIMVGGLLTIIYKSQNSIYVYEGPFYKQNFHPYIQTFTMFIGELLCLPLFFLIKWKYPEEVKQRQKDAISQGKKLGMNRLYLIVPAMCDLVTSTLHFIALNFVSTSAYQMVNGGNIVTCFLLAIFFLGQPILKSQLMGSCLAVIGIIIVGIANILHVQEDSVNSSAFMEAVGYILLIISLFTSGFFFTFEQKLMSIYHLEPIQIVGYQGLFGIIAYGIIATVLSFVPCNFGVNACVFTEDGYPYMESWSSFFSQIFDNKILLLLTFCWIFNVTAYNPLGVTITKHINALARAISDVCQTALVWTIGIIVTMTLGKTYPNLVWEKLDPVVIILQLIGFVFLVFGNLIYNQIISFSFLQKNKKDQSVMVISESEDFFKDPILPKKE